MSRHPANGCSVEHVGQVLECHSDALLGFHEVHAQIKLSLFFCLWKGLERRQLDVRGKPDLILALAFMHHLVIGRNIPLAEMVEWFARFGADLVIEFVGLDDPMVKRLLRNRTGQRMAYSAEALELALNEHFSSVTQETLDSGNRTLYYAQTRPNGG